MLEGSSYKIHVWKITTEGVRPTYIQDGRNTTEGDGGGIEAEKKNVERWDTGGGWINRGRPHRGIERRDRARDTSTHQQIGCLQTYKY